MKQLLLFFIRVYRQGISPYLPACCRYMPSCSAYAYEAVAMHGAAKGFVLALWRVLRCNPFSRGGYDPVPEHFADAFIRRRKAMPEPRQAQ